MLSRVVDLSCPQGREVHPSVGSRSHHGMAPRRSGEDPEVRPCESTGPSPSTRTRAERDPSLDLSMFFFRRMRSFEQRENIPWGALYVRGTKVR